MPPGPIVDTQLTIAATPLGVERSYTATAGGASGQPQGVRRRATLDGPPRVAADPSVAIEGRTAGVALGGVGPAPA
jgi:hypothetical protein